MIELASLNDIHRYLKTIEPGTLIALDNTFGFYMTHSYTKKTDNTLSFPYIAINPARKKSNAVIQERYYAFHMVNQRQIYGLSTPIIEGMHQSLFEGNTLEPAGMHIFEGETGGEERWISEYTQDIINQLQRYGYDDADSHLIRRLKKEVEPIIKQSLASQNIHTPRLKIVG